MCSYKSSWQRSFVFKASKKKHEYVTRLCRSTRVSIDFYGFVVLYVYVLIYKVSSFYTRKSLFLYGFVVLHVYVLISKVSSF